MDTVQQRLATAWTHLKDRIEAKDSGLAASIMSSRNLDATEHCVMEICSLLNPLWGAQPVAYKATGDGTITLTGVGVTKFDGVQQAPAEFPTPPPPDRVSLPVKFQALTVEGTFDLNQPCVEQGMFGDIGAPVPCRQGGTFVRSYGSGTMAFVGSMASHTLSIEGIVLLGTPDMHIDLAPGLPGDVQAMVGHILSFLMGPVEQILVRQLNNPTAMPGFAAFSKETVALLNKLIAAPNP